ncbi:hypothetical protein BC835DRAFT_1413495 [Cytidiella melzeri]|nr:hypothetical protein BC835DRAFT_1413495 [Cytidiella melzeri]
MAVRLTIAEQLSRPTQPTSPTLSAVQLADNEQTSSEDPARGSLRPSSQSVVPAMVIGFKRANDDDAAEASGRITRKLKLDSKDSELLALASKMPLQEQVLFCIGLSLKTMATVNQIQPADAQFKLSDILKGKIEIYTYNTLVSPHAAGYLEECNRIVLGILRRHPTWGLTAAVVENPTHYHAVCSHVAKRLNDKRRHIKAAIKSSTGIVDEADPNGQPLEVMDIVKLVSHATKVKGSTGMKAHSVKITVQLLARFAFLRRAFVELPAGSSVDYWKTVDKQLQSIRERFKDQPKHAMSAFFKRILDDDLEQFGANKDATLDDFQSAVPLTDVQTEVEEAIAGIITVPTDDEADNTE